MILVVDNYDSFTHNIIRYINELGVKTHITYNDIKYSKLELENYDAVLLSPGPSQPQNSGICSQIVKDCVKKEIPLLGICLGMQIIAQHFGYQVQKCEEHIHGKASIVNHNKNNTLFKNIPKSFYAGRYHSLNINANKNCSQTTITCYTKDKKIPMALEHKKLPIYAIQFHPESILTEYGYQILANFINSFTLLDKSTQQLVLALNKKLYEQRKPK